MSRSEGRLNQYSSRGVAVPVAGAIGGGDDFAQRIGKPYVPKPFRSMGGFEGSADSTFSYKLGRHHVDDREDVGDTFNFDAIATRKLAGPRKLSRNVKMKGLGQPNMSDFEPYGAKAIISTAVQYENLLREFTDDLLRADFDVDDDLELDEFSGVGNVAGYMIPFGAGPARKKDFYKKMAKPYGGSYLNDPLKIKPRP